MTRPEDTAEELEHVQAMIDLLRLEVEAPPIARQPPDPDAEAVIGGRRVAIEHTRVVDGAIAAGDDARTWVKEKVRATLRSAGIVAWVDLRLPQSVAASLHRAKADIDPEVAAIVAIAREAHATMSPGDSWVRYEYRDEARQSGVRDLRDRGLKYIVSVWIHSSDEIIVTTRGPGAIMRASAIQAAIDKKALKLAGYRARGFAEVWLLVVGSSGPGGSIDVHEAEDEFGSPFDRTFFLELFEGKAVELRTKP